MGTVRPRGRFISRVKFLVGVSHGSEPEGNYCALASLDSPCYRILPDQSFGLDTGITADFPDQIQ